MSASGQRSGLKRQTMSAALTDELRERILNLDIPEGRQLRQDSLAAEFGVSRIPVREALLQLEGEGLVRLTAHKGYTVTALSLQDIRELFDLRALIEVDLLRLAIPRLGEADIARARRVLATFDDRLSHHTQEGDWGRLNWELHAALYEPAGRPRALAIVHNLHRNADRYLRLQLKLTEHNNERARDEHNRLVRLCAQRNATDATCLLNEHILAARDDLIAFLAERRGRQDPKE